MLTGLVYSAHLCSLLLVGLNKTYCLVDWFCCTIRSGKKFHILTHVHLSRFLRARSCIKLNLNARSDTT